MIKKVYLIRHSYAENAGMTKDMNRALTHQGQTTVRALGRYLSKQDFSPDIILCSPAVRTRETAQNLIEELEISESILTFKDKIYNASVRELLSAVNELDETNKRVAMISHNPAISYFGEFLTGEDIGGMEPCSMVNIELNQIKWSEVSQGVGNFISYVHPNRL